MSDSSQRSPNDVALQSHEEWLADYEGHPNSINSKTLPTFTTPSFEDDDDFGIDGELPARVADGVYTARYVAHETRKDMYGDGKLKLILEIQTEGEFKGVCINRWYNVTLKGKPGIGGKFSVKPLSDYRREYVKVFEGAMAKRKDRLSPRLLMGIDLEIEVESVTKDRHGEQTANELHYSKVKRIIGRA